LHCTRKTQEIILGELRRRNSVSYGQIPVYENLPLKPQTYQGRREQEMLDEASVENWYYDSPWEEYSCPHDQYQTEEYQLPQHSMKAGKREKKQKATVFFDLSLATHGQMERTALEKYSLERVALEILQDYSSCQCGPSTGSFEAAFLLHDIDTWYAGSRRLDSRAMLFAATGSFKAPPEVDTKKLVRDSIGGSRRRRRLAKMRDLEEWWILSQTHYCQDFVDASFTERLNQTKAFEGRVLDASSENEAYCEDSVEKCCEYINIDAVNCTDPWPITSLCSLQCCCSHPDAECCKGIFEVVGCAGGIQGYCFGTPVPTFYESSTIELTPNWVS